MVGEFTRVECTSAPGLGRDHAWTLRVDGSSVSKAAHTSYGVPVIERLEVVGRFKPFADTRGAGARLHSSWLRAKGCAVLADGIIECRLVAGVGTGLRTQCSLPCLRSPSLALILLPRA